MFVVVHPAVANGSKVGVHADAVAAGPGDLKTVDHDARAVDDVDALSLSASDHGFPLQLRLDDRRRPAGRCRMVADLPRALVDSRLDDDGVAGAHLRKGMLHGRPGLCRRSVILRAPLQRHVKRSLHRRLRRGGTRLCRASFDERSRCICFPRGPRRPIGESPDGDEQDPDVNGRVFHSFSLAER